MRDEMVRAITADGLVRAQAITGRDLVETARNLHTLFPVATAALGRCLMACSMMGDQLKGAERFCDIIVRAQGQPVDLIRLPVFGRQHDNRIGVCFSDFTAQCKSFYIRQHNVQKDNVRLLGGVGLHRLPPGVGADRIIALQLQVHPDEVYDAGLIVYNQYLHPCPSPRRRNGMSPILLLFWRNVYESLFKICLFGVPRDLE